MINVDPWDMLNNFCFHVWAPTWLFVMLVCCHAVMLNPGTCWTTFVLMCRFKLYEFCFHRWKWQSCFLDFTLSCEWRDHRAGSQLKSSDLCISDCQWGSLITFMNVTFCDVKYTFAFCKHHFAVLVLYLLYGRDMRSMETATTALLVASRSIQRVFLKCQI